jgi:processive 1,2-diacylglycerol beta-glucosyltransferase
MAFSGGPNVILLLTAGFGDGHNTAARNVMNALNRLAPGEDTQLVDVFDLAHPITAPLMKQGYQMLITRAPWAWAWMFARTAKMNFEKGLDTLSPLRKVMGDLLVKHQPRAVVCTYPIYPKVLQQLRTRGHAIPPVFTIITDSISIHPTWMLAPSDAYFVADGDSKQSAIKLGANAALVHVTGFPVSLDFIETPAPEECASPNGKMLYLPSTGVSHVARTLDALAPMVKSGVRLTLPLGKHAARLHQVVTRFRDSVPADSVEVLGWTNLIPHLLKTHDIVICKAGGAILHEALAATCPAVIDYVVPGQEEGNAELLTKHECGVTTKTPQETGEQAARLLANGLAEAKRMKANMRAHSEPDAAIKIAQQVLALA